MTANIYHSKTKEEIIKAASQRNVNYLPTPEKVAESLIDLLYEYGLHRKRDSGRSDAVYRAWKMLIWALNIPLDEDISAYWSEDFQNKEDARRLLISKLKEREQLEKDIAALRDELYAEPEV